ncbi:MAG: NADPH-dependent 7-cyano-7-deazaguanine reductase QueF [Chitinivibrionales bacterium]|nr:NADPH-dependent 7-cyano-7-deazaguanine reductase QueF [Chitinivibrionales bacterium]
MSLETALAEKRLPPLETFEKPYETADPDTGVVRIVFPEFTCVCPRTGYPDFATVELYYLPEKLCVELKSWKLYLNAFRMIGTFHERVTAHLFEVVCETLRPRWAMVIGDFFPRGNVDTTVVFEMPTARPRGVDVLLGRREPHCRGFGGHGGDAGAAPPKE